MRMSEGDDPITAAARELAKQLPVKRVYKEGLSPAVREIGGTLADVMKVLRLALAPVQALAALQDRYKRFLDQSVRRVPEDRRIAPPPQILGPVLEGIRYEPEGTPIDEMFSELLSKSMDRESLNQAHPAYPILIRQLSPDEAKILKLLRSRTYKHVFTRNYDRDRNLFIGPQKIELDEFPRDEITFPENIGFYIDHLHELGLGGIYQVGNQEALRDSDGSQTAVRVNSEYRLTDFGAQFVKACTGD